jgi:hypothetical protein
VATATMIPWRLQLAAAQNELPARTPAAPGETPERARARIDRDFLTLGDWRRANRARLDEGIRGMDGRGWTDQARTLCRAAGVRYDELDQAWAGTWPSLKESRPYPAARVSYRRADGTPWPPLPEGAL